MEEDDYINSAPKVASVTSPLNESAKVSCQTASVDDQAYYNFPQQSGLYNVCTCTDTFVIHMLPTYSASSVIRTPLFQAPEKSVQISEFVWITEAH